MADQTAPADVMALAEARVRARVARDFQRADELRASIEAAGWRVVDDGASFTLYPARVPDRTRAGQTVYGALVSVPTNPTDPALRATVAVLDAGAAGRAIAETLSDQRLDATEIVAVIPDDADTPAADAVLRTVEPWGVADALAAAVRTAHGPLIVVLDGSVVPDEDVIGPLASALADPSVAVAGVEGLFSSDLVRFEAAGGNSATAVGAGCYAFRREDLLALGPLDQRLRTPQGLATWLSLLLRDQGPNLPPRRAAVVHLPLTPAASPGEIDARAARRDAYRIRDRFRACAWLGSEEPPGGHIVGDGAQEHHGDHDPDQPGHAREA